MSDANDAKQVDANATTQNEAVQPVAGGTPPLVPPPPVTPTAAAVRAANIEKIDLSARYFVYFMYGGLIFLFAGLLLLILSGYMSYRMINHEPDIFAGLGEKPDSNMLMARALNVYFPIIITIVSAFVCTMVGTRLLRSSGIVSTQVIAPQDYPLLGEAIASGNEQAINLFVRLSSLSGATGTFTKIGLTGLPLATIFLTILLALGGIINAQFYDLAKLTLGAFLGSFVQRQSQSEVPTTRLSSSDAARTKN